MKDTELGQAERKSQNPKSTHYKLYLPLMNKITIILYRCHANHMPVEYYSSSFLFDETLAGFIHDENGE